MKASGILVFVLIFCTRVFAQLPPVCGAPNPPLAKTCGQACILCNLDGYTSGTTQTTQGQILPGFCTQVVHSMGYMGFVAGSSNLTIQVSVGNCTLGNSIEMGIYQSENCQDFNLVSDCNTAMFTGNTYTFTNTEPLNAGCPYFLVFDNNGPASCAFSVSVVDGSATAPAIGQASTPSGPDKVCPGATTVYTIPPLFGACEYRWTAPQGTLINGMASPVTLGHDEGASVTVTWGNVGGQLCVRGANPCSTGPFSCLPVNVGPIPPTDLPPVSICFGETFDWLDGNTYNTSKLLTYTYVTSLGCDSVVRQQLTVRPPIITSLGVLRICAGECLAIGENQYCASGNFSETFTSYLGCDSTVFFSVVVIPVEANIAEPDTISCQQTAILLDGSGSTPGVQYAWFDTSGQAFLRLSGCAGQYSRGLHARRQPDGAEPHLPRHCICNCAIQYTKARYFGAGRHPELFEGARAVISQFQYFRGDICMVGARRIYFHAAQSRHFTGGHLCSDCHCPKWL